MAAPRDPLKMPVVVASSHQPALARFTDTALSYQARLVAVLIVSTVVCTPLYNLGTRAQSKATGSIDGMPVLSSIAILPSLLVLAFFVHNLYHSTWRKYGDRTFRRGVIAAAVSMAVGRLALGLTAPPDVSGFLDPPSEYVAYRVAGVYYYTAFFWMQFYIPAWLYRFEERRARVARRGHLTSGLASMADAPNAGAEAAAAADGASGAAIGGAKTALRDMPRSGAGADGSSSSLVEVSLDDDDDDGNGGDGKPPAAAAAATKPTSRAAVIRRQLEIVARRESWSRSPSMAVASTVITTYGWLSSTILVITGLDLQRLSPLVLPLWLIALWRDRGRDMRGDPAYQMMLAFMMAGLPVGLGQFTLQVVEASRESPVMQVVAVVLFHGVVGAVYVCWQRTTGPAVGDRDAARPYDLIFFWIAELYSEMVFMDIEPLTGAFFFLVVVQRAKDLVLHSQVHDRVLKATARELMRRSSATGPGLQRRSSTAAIARALATVMPGTFDAARAASERVLEDQARMLYARWHTLELIIFADVMATVAVVVGLAMEYLTIDAGTGTPLFSSRIKQTTRSPIFVAYACILVSQLAVGGVVRHLMNQRLDRMKGRVDKHLAARRGKQGGAGADAGAAATVEGLDSGTSFVAVNPLLTNGRAHHAGSGNAANGRQSARGDRVSVLLSVPSAAAAAKAGRMPRATMAPGADTAAGAGTEGTDGGSVPRGSDGGGGVVSRTLVVAPALPPKPRRGSTVSSSRRARLATAGARAGTQDSGARHAGSRGRRSSQSSLKSKRRLSILDSLHAPDEAGAGGGTRAGGGGVWTKEKSLRDFWARHWLSFAAVIVYGVGMSFFRLTQLRAVGVEADATAAAEAAVAAAAATNATV